MTRTAAGRPSRLAGARSRKAAPEAAVALAPIGWLALVAWASVLLFASPDATGLWGANGFRSNPGAWPALILAAAATAAWCGLRPRATVLWAALGMGLALALAFPWREHVHFLGDTQLRMRALFAIQLPGPSASAAQWWNWIGLTANTLHAAPLDLLVDVIPVLALHGAGMTVADAVAWIDLALALAYLVLGWRLAHRLAPDRRSTGPLALALVLTGTLEAFAGYADSSGLIAVAALGWWSAMLAPLERPSGAIRLTAWFLALLLAHRIGIAMIVPQLLRALGPALPALGPALPADRPAARRTLLALTGGVVTIAIAAALGTIAGRQLVRDLTEIARSARVFAPRLEDVFSALMVVAPLALVTPALVGKSIGSSWGEPRALWIAAGALPLLVGLLWVFPLGENGLGAHRDWDTNVLLGVTSMVGSTIALARAGAPRLGPALTAALPLAALTALSWVAVNADSGLATRRAIALATSPTALTEAQRAHLEVYFGQRAMDERRPDVAALHYERAFRAAGNPRRALLAAEAFLMAGDAGRARAAIAEARATGKLSPDLENGARQLEAQMSRGDSARAR